ncbi:DegT/DnrJ/EryC1/StrS family aminotransferase [Methanolobus bombayensis]|uniref:DegT/DnrJ/EryC1/StrS family aminotransferase n=1 Tax=Methanolobus bombayensis TaxID=38023 RepID=UPI001AE90C4B|nr:DegT/DnrJ/EryC1/StrS family aminotransferase [Methanolobus bombayensis]MBP1908193.1 perosamine synthetase [Methanolobus bombayensis]
MNWKIPLFKIFWDESDIENVSNSIKSGMSWAEGPDIQEFERLIADFISTKYCVTFNSGTSAQHASMLAYGISKGDEVIVPSFTFISTANTPLFVGAKPVFADIEEQTLGLNPDSVLEKITPRTKAIMPIHYGGCPCMIRELKEIADDYNLILIEDAAEAFGASVKGKKVGTFGDSTMLSFCQNKVITTGEGGAMVTDSDEIYRKLKLVRSHGRADNSQYFSSTISMDYVTLGYNFRMSSLTASLGIAQMKKVDAIIKMRQDNSSYLNSRLKKEVAEHIYFPNMPEGHVNVYQLYTVIANDRDGLQEHLANKGIMSKVYFSPVHRSHFYRNVLKYECDLPVTDKIADNVLTLPMYPDLKLDEMDYLIDEITNYYEGN